MVKKLLLLMGLALFGFSQVNAQETSFGVTAGYTDISVKMSGSDLAVSGSRSGFYIGGLADIAVAEQFHVQPELLYARAKDGNFIYVPVLAKYYIVDSGFQIVAGPQANFALDADDGTKSFGLDIAFGMAFDITENIFVEARYAFNITNRLEDAPSDVNLHLNTLNVGLGYKF